MIYKELLVNLLGFKGTLIQVDVAGGRQVWRLHGDLPVDRGVRCLAEEILVLGPLAVRVRAFLEAMRKPSWAADISASSDAVKNLRDKVYTPSLCEGIDEIVAGYEADIAALYDEADAPYMSVPQISATLAPWLDTFPALCSLIAEIERRPAQLLSIVDVTVRSHASQQVFVRLQQRLNMLLLTHIANFLVWGVLPDQAGFFIEEGGQAPATGAGADLPPPGRSSTGSAAGKRHEVELVSLFLPQYVPTHLAILIVTVGQYARRMRASADGGDFMSRVLLPEDAFALHGCICNDEVLGSGSLNTTLLEDIVSQAEKVIGYQLWANVEQQLGVTLRGIGDFYLGFRGDMWRSFSEVALELISAFGGHVIAHREATAALTVSTLERAAIRLREKLVSAFHIAYVTHKRATSSASGSAAPSPASDDYVCPAVPLHLRHGYDDTPFYESIKFSAISDKASLSAAFDKLTEPVPVEDKSSQSIRFANFMLATVRTMRLDTSMDKAVAGLFDDQCMELLGNVFSHCMYLSQTEVMLARTWRACVTAQKMLLTEQRHQRTFHTTYDERVKQGALLIKPLLLLRHKMSFFLDNLKVYMLTDVMHTRYSKLQEQLSHDVNTFESARAAIKQCLQEISKDAFLVDPDRSNHLVLVTIRQAVRCCIQCWYISHQCFDQPGRRDDVCRSMGALSDHHAVLTELSLAFDKCVRNLYSVLSTNTHVNKYRQLLTRLNFNGHFSKVHA